MVIAYISTFLFSFFILFSFYHSIKMSRYTKITRKKLNITTKNKAINYPHKMSTNDLIDTIDRYDSKRKSYSN